MNNAIYIRDSYALLPEDFPTFDAFLADLSGRELPCTYALRPLLENNRIRQGANLRGQCMAPCFLSDVPSSPVPVVIHSADEVYPAQVELLPMAEYNARLREVVRRCCPGCQGYTPIDDSDASLDGHHGEISLNGVCFYRQEAERSAPSLRMAMHLLGDAFLTQGLADAYFGDVHDALDEFTHGALEATNRITGDDGAICIGVACRRREPLAPLLLHAHAAHIRRLTEDAVRLIPDGAQEIDPGALLSPENRPALQSACRKHGFALGLMTWDGRDDGRVAESLRRLEAQMTIHILHVEETRALLMLTEPADAMKAIRYRTPMMMAHGATLDLHDEQGSRRYTISYDMPFQPLT